VTADGKTVLVTGASRGLGRSVAIALLKEGANVVGTGRDATAMRDTEEIAEQVGGKFTIITIDVRDEEAVVSLIADLPKLDVLINNAGIARARPTLETTTAELREVIDVNVIGAFVVMREAARKMRGGGGGRIINIASDAAIKGLAGMAPYVASKHALLGMGRSVGLELGDQNIGVTTFCPGPIDTEIMGPGSLSGGMDPDLLAATVVHLASTPPSIDIQELLLEPIPAG